MVLLYTYRPCTIGRDEQEAILKSSPDLSIGDVISVNVTMLTAGQQLNVLPSQAR